ncbi:hypothetical protein C8R43DRAFT_1019563 [Mycena crocata]|nr:hypothetical protein C8R43DRAFT_1019563 [Mycena crocata]
MWRAVQRRTFGHKPSHRSILLRTRVNLHNGKTSTTYALQMLGAANVHLVQDNPGPLGPFTIVVFNILCLDALKLDEKDIPAPHWNSILAHLTLPALERVRLETDGIDATVLGEFLLRHRKLHTFKYHSWESPGREHSSPLIRPIIAHPSLTRIEGHGPDSIRLVLECLNMSPNLDTFVFRYAHSASINLLALNPAFRLLAERSARSAHLQLCIYEHERRVSGDPGTWCLVDGETADIARSLHCLRTIEMMCWSVEMVLETLPWLVLLPGIEHVRVVLCLGDESQEEGDLDEVEVKVKEALAHATVTWMQIQASGSTE